MKKKILFISLILLSMLVHSCSSDEDIYCCDPDINAWVKDNIDEIRTMSRSQWLKMDDAIMQKATYIAFEAKQKEVFWIERYNEILNLAWSEKEKEHILKLLDFINNRPNFFNRDYLKNKDNSEEFDLFAYRWINHAVNELKWTNRVIVSIVASGGRMISTQGELEDLSTHKGILTRVKSSTETGKDCTCSTVSDMCDPTGEFQQRCRSDGPFACDRHENDPDEWFDGCGLFFKFACDGNCGHLWAT